MSALFLGSLYTCLMFKFCCLFDIISISILISKTLKIFKNKLKNLIRLVSTQENFFENLDTFWKGKLADTANSTSCFLLFSPPCKSLKKRTRKVKRKKWSKCRCLLSNFSNKNNKNIRNVFKNKTNSTLLCSIPPVYYCHGILFIPSSYCKELILRMNSTSPYRSTFGLPHLYFLILNPGVLQTCHGPLDMEPIISVHKQRRRVKLMHLEKGKKWPIPGTCQTLISSKNVSSSTFNLLDFFLSTHKGLVSRCCQWTCLASLSMTSIFDVPKSGQI